MSLDLAATPCSVHCCLLDDSHDAAGECIHFATPTDALLAELHLVQRVPARYIDAFLQLLKTPQFDPETLSFTRTVDIDAGVAAFRGVRSQRRLEDGSGQGWVGSRLCYDLVPLLVQKIVEDREPLHATPDGTTVTATPPPTHVASRLKALALAHRVFTLPAQRALGGRIVVSRAEHLRALTQSSLLGPWTHALLVHSAFASAREFQYTCAEEALAALAGVLGRATGLKYLKLRTPGAVHDPAALTAVLDAVRKLSGLETLVWLAPLHAGRYGRVDVERVCEVVKAMPSLHTLVLQNVRAGWVSLDQDNESIGNADEMEVEAFSTRSPSRGHNLKSLSLTGVDCPIDPLGTPSISWLLSSTNPNNERGVTDLSLDLSTNADTLAAAFASSDTLACLHTLRLAFARPPARPLLWTLFTPSSSQSTTAFPDPDQAAQPFTTPLHSLDIRIAPSPSSDAVLLASEAGIPCSVRTLRLTLLHLHPLQTSPASSSPFQPSPGGSWRSAAAAMARVEAVRRHWHAQEAELVSLVKNTSGSPALESMEVATPFQPLQRAGDEDGDDNGNGVYQWTDLRAACAARGIALTLRTELTC